MGSSCLFLLSRARNEKKKRDCAEIVWEPLKQQKSEV